MQDQTNQGQVARPLEYRDRRADLTTPKVVRQALAFAALTFVLTVATTFALFLFAVSIDYRWNDRSGYTGSIIAIVVGALSFSAVVALSARYYRDQARRGRAWGIWLGCGAAACFILWIFFGIQY